MTIRNIKAAPTATKRAGLQFDLAPKALESWNPQLALTDDNGDYDNVITIFEPIGYDWWTGEGVTASRIAGALRQIGDGNDVVVNINSPGGDVFEGLAIYNLLREHNGKVTVNILGIAASAASFIAMAGDQINIGKAAFLMIHNAWTIAAGNRNDLRAVADYLEPFDGAIADVYADRTGIDIKDITEVMDSETWINGKTAVSLGWADGYLESDVKEKVSNRSDQIIVARRMDAALAKASIPRSERKTLMNEFKATFDNKESGNDGMPSATVIKEDMPSAVQLDVVSSELTAKANELSQIIAGMRS